MINILIVVEGERLEKKVISKIFNLIGFEVVSEERFGNFSKYELKNGNNVVYLIPGPKNDINSMMLEFDEKQEDLSKYFGIEEVVAENYLVYDIDTNDLNIFNNLISKFNNPQEGLVVLSNPCIEVLADYEKNHFHNKPSEYKKHITKRLLHLNHRDLNESSETYIISNIIKLLIKEINDNSLLFDSGDVYEHIEVSYQVVQDNITNTNEGIYLYKNLFSVLYIVLSGVFRLYKYNDNATELKRILEKYN